MDKSTTLKVGVPLFVFLLGGVYVLTNFMQTHMEIKDKRTKSSSKRVFDLEEERDMLMKKLDIENFTLSRIPRVDDGKELNENKKGSKQ